MIFLKKQIAFKENFETLPFKEDTVLGHNDILDSDIHIKIEKDKVYEEAPCVCKVYFSNDEGKYILPDIRFGVYENKLYIYAMQNSKEKNFRRGKVLC